MIHLEKKINAENLVKIMVVDKIIKECKIHGKTLHGVYSYSGSIHTRCLQCAKEQKIKRHLNPEKKAHDRAYNKNWSLEKGNEYFRQKKQELSTKKYAKRISKVCRFIENERETISILLLKLKSTLSLDDIKEHCIKFTITSLDKLFEFIKSNKRSKLLNAETWKASTLLKYHLGIRENYSKQPKFIKEKIRKMYKKDAAITVNKKMKMLLS